MSLFFFFQAEDGIRDLVRSRGLGDVYKRQAPDLTTWEGRRDHAWLMLCIQTGLRVSELTGLNLSLIHI